MGSAELETDDLLHKAVIWPATGRNDRYGRQKVGPAEEVNVRWEWAIDLNADDLERNKSIVATIYVDRVISIGSILWKGELENLPTEPIHDRVEVIGYKEVYDVKGIEARRSVSVAKYHGNLPTAD